VLDGDAFRTDATVPGWRNITAALRHNARDPPDPSSFSASPAHEPDSPALADARIQPGLVGRALTRDDQIQWDVIIGLDLKESGLRVAFASGRLVESGPQ
jgi:hypothetical protein